MDAKLLFLAVICLGFSSTVKADDFPVVNLIESGDWLCDGESNELSVSKVVVDIKKDASDYLVKIPFDVCKGLIITYTGTIVDDWVFDLWEETTKQDNIYPFRMHVYFGDGKIAFSSWKENNWGHVRGENKDVTHALTKGNDVTVQIKIDTDAPKGKFLIKVNDVQHDYEVPWDRDLKLINYLRVHTGINLKTVEFSKDA